MTILERRPLEIGRDYALRLIKENIISLELAPGSQISEKELAAELGLSRTPIREALIELAKVKIVDIQPQKKTTVAPVDYRLVEEARFIRLVMECAVIELACRQAQPEDLQRLKKNVKLQNFYLENDDPDTLMHLDNEFHRTLFEIAEKPQAFDLIQNVSVHFDRVRSMALSSVKDLRIVQDHADMAAAIERRDPEAARALMEKHLSRYKIDAEAIRAAYPQYFK